jgi:hypothetical protein
VGNDGRGERGIGDAAGIQNETLLRISSESLRDCREDLRSTRSFAAAAFAIPTAVLINDAGQTPLSIVLAVLTFAAGALVMLPSRVSMLIDPVGIDDALRDHTGTHVDDAIRKVALASIGQIAEARRVCRQRRRLWLVELLLAAAVLGTFVVRKL